MDLTLGWESQDLVFFPGWTKRPALVQERRVSWEKNTVLQPRVSHLKDSSEARRLRDAWWFQQNGNVESRQYLSELK